MTGWLTALRIARRDARRAKGRTALVIALIGLPVLGLAFVAISADTFRLSPAERADRQVGAGDIVLEWPYDSPVRQHPTELSGFPDGAVRDRGQATEAEVLAALPAGSRVIPRWDDARGFRTVTGTADLETVELDYTDPLARGVLVPLAGRAPASADEVALSPYAAERVGAGVGDTLRADKGTRSWTVVGLVEDPTELRRQFTVFPPGTLHSLTPPPRPADNGDAAGPVVTGADGRQMWIVDAPGPLSWLDVKRLNRAGIVALSRAVLLDPPPDSEIPPELVAPPSRFPVAPLLGGMLVLEVVLLAGPAFAVGARGRRRELALVAANGGTPAHLRRIVLADGVVLGAAAAAAGILLGGLAAVAGRPLVQEYVAQSRPGAFRVYPAALAAVAGLALLAGVLAALVPAWTASRQPVVAALSGRYAVTATRRRWAFAGLALLAVGVVLTVAGGGGARAVLTAAGLMVGQVGLVLCTPTIIGLLSRLGGRLPLGPRIALRDVGRNRASAAPAVSAVLAAVSMSALVGTLYLANDRQNVSSDLPTVIPPGYAAAAPESLRPATPQAHRAAETALRASLPVTAVVPYGVVTCSSPGAKPGAKPAVKAFPEEDEGFGCYVRPQVPVARRCPYAAIAEERELATDEQRAARRDGRCDSMDVSLRTSYGSVSPSIAVVEPDDLRHLARLDQAVADAAVATLRAGGMVVDNARLVEDGQVTAKVIDKPYEGMHEPPGRMVRLPGYALPPGVDSPTLTLSPATLDRLRLDSRPAGLVAATSRTPTVAERDRLNAAMAAVPGWQVSVEARPVREDNPYLVLLAIGAGLITLGAAAIATGLAAAHGRADLTTLAAVGASPGVRRALSISQTGLIAGLGSALGLAAGIGAALAFIIGTNRANGDIWPAPPQMPFAVPWLNVVVSLVVVPLVAVLGAGLLTRPRLPIERRPGM